MLSLLLTAVLLLGALVAALHLRSVWRVAVVFALAAAGAFLLAGRAPDGLAQPRMHLVYEVDEEHANEPGPDLVARTAAVVSSRVSRLGLAGAEVQAVGHAIDIRAPGGQDEYERIAAALATVGLLEFVPVDDDQDFFREFEADPETAKRGIRIQQENAPLGPDRSAPRRYAFLPRGERETMADARRRFEAWIGTLSVPAERRVALEKTAEYNPETDSPEVTGWRTFLLHRAPVLTGRHVEAAQAQPDTNAGSLGGWRVALALTSEGGRLFEEATGRMIKRRFAIVVDGVVESAPVVQTRIAGGHVVITMGQGPVEEQAANARQLEAVLRSGALPAPLLLAKVERLDAPLGPGVFSALTAAAGLLLLAEIVLSFWLLGRGRERAPRAA